MTKCNTEGVVKYQLDFTRGPALSVVTLRSLIGWQQQLQRLGLLGRDPTRYGGLAFGNLSIRLADGSFAITGTQSADCSIPTPSHYARVIAWDCRRNHITATGPIQPSSESLTHAALYDVDPRIGSIFHTHSPIIWQARDRLQLASTAITIAYGTPAMATEVARLYRQQAFIGHGVLAMAGHEDGILSFGRNPDEAGQAMVTLLARATGLS